jgi:hypothetical protein
MGHARATYLKDAILKSLGKEDDPMGILIEAVLEKELNSYDDLLKDCKNIIKSKMRTAQHEGDLISKIDKKLDEGRIKSGGPISG